MSAPPSSLLGAIIAVLTVSVRNRRRAEEDLAITLLSIGDGVDRHGPRGARPAAQPRGGARQRAGRRGRPSGRPLGEVFRHEGRAPRRPQRRCSRQAVGRGGALHLAGGHRPGRARRQERRVERQRHPHPRRQRLRSGAWSSCSATSPSGRRSRSSCGRRRRWRPSAASPAASRTTSTTCSAVDPGLRRAPRCSGSTRASPLHDYARARSPKPAERAAALTAQLLTFSAQAGDRASGGRPATTSLARHRAACSAGSIGEDVELVASRPAPLARCVGGPGADRAGAGEPRASTRATRCPSGGTLTISTADVGLDARPAGARCPRRRGRGATSRLTRHRHRARASPPRRSAHIFEPVLHDQAGRQGDRARARGRATARSGRQRGRSRCKQRSSAPVPRSGSCCRGVAGSGGGAPEPGASRAPARGSGCILMIDDEKIMRRW